MDHVTVGKVRVSLRFFFTWMGRCTILAVYDRNPPSLDFIALGMLFVGALERAEAHADLRMVGKMKE